MARRFPILNSVATVAYKQHTPDMGVLIGTSIGNNRQRAGLIYARTLAPWSTFRKVDGDAAGRPVYQAQLDKNIDEIEAQLVEISRKVQEDDGHPRLVFACFEDLSQRGSYCHRTWLREWLITRYGLMVPELGKLPRTGDPLGSTDPALV